MEIESSTVNVGDTIKWEGMTFTVQKIDNSNMGWNWFNDGSNWHRVGYMELVTRIGRA